jgi:hypothetical protein
MLFILVEEISIKPILEKIISQIEVKFGNPILFKVIPHQGKQDLENSLSKTLPTLSKQPDSSILIIRDQDSGNCQLIKGNISNIIQNAQVSVKYKIRIACTEMENWLLGDLNAINSAFPRFVVNKYASKTEFRTDVDSIVNPVSKMIKIIPEYKGKKHIPKVENARKISMYLNIENNLSKSFNQTVLAIQYLT